MPTCSEAYGSPNWVGEYPNCRYEASTPPGTGQEQAPFTGTVGSLGYGEELAGSSWAADWQQFFDPYDPAREEMAVTGAGIDIGQLQSAWDLQSRQLGEALGLGREQQGEAWRLQEGGLGEQWGGRQQELGAGARRGFQDVTRMGEQRRVQGRGLKFGEQRQRQAEEEVSGAYTRSFGLGQSAYEQAIASGQSRYRQSLEAGTMGYGQAMETGELALQQGTTDIYQGLQEDVFGARERWDEQNRATLNVLLGSGIWGGGSGLPGGGGPPMEGVTCCDGSTQMLANLCGVGNRPWECAGDEGDIRPPGDKNPPGDNNPPPGTCTDPNRSYQCADGTCVGSFLECLDTGTGTETGKGTGTGTGTGTGAGDSGTSGWAGTGGSGGCFIAGTLIQLPSGIKSIEDIKVGDIVTSFDVGTSSIIDSEVTKTYVHSDRYYIILNGIIKTTSVHPFYCDGKWVEAGDLSIGDKILHVDGLEHTIETIELSDKPVTVYNFEVDGTHNYFAEGYLVHNKTTLPPWG